MTDPRKKLPTTTAKPQHCPRLGREVPEAEHRDCPYCFGDDAGIAKGDRKEYCDFEPGKDPVHFGFPDNEDVGRRRG